MRTRRWPYYARVLSGIIAGLALLWIAPLRSHATTTNAWSGAGADDNWTTTGNWSGSVAPSPGNNLNFPWISNISGNSATPSNNFADGTVFGQINVGILNLANVKSYIFNGNRIVVTNGISTSGGLGSATFNLNITLGANQTFTASRAMTFNGSLDLNTNNLILNNSASVTFNGMVTNGVLFSTGYGITKTNTGTMLISSNAQFANNIPVTVVDGTLILDGTVNQYAYSYGTLATISGTGMAYDVEADNGGILSPGDGGPGTLSCSFFNGLASQGTIFGALDILVQSAGAPGTNYSQLTVSTNYFLGYSALNPLFFGSAALNIKWQYTPQIGDSFLILKLISGAPYSFSANGSFLGLPTGGISDQTNGCSLGILYDTNGVTLTTLRTPSSPFVLWRGSVSSTFSNSVYGDRYWSSTNNWAEGLMPTNGGQAMFSPYQLTAYDQGFNRIPIPPLTNDLPAATSLASLLFTGTNYALYGNPLTLTDSISNQVSNGTNFCYLDLVTIGSLALEVDPGGTFVLDDSLNGSGTVSKEGGGLVIYTGTTMDAFVGTVVVDNGTLQVDGSFTDGSFIVNGGLLDGTGTVSSVTLYGGTIKPGDSPGILHVEGDLDMSPGAVFKAELNGPVHGSGYDQLQVNGAVNLNGATLNLIPGFAPTPGTAFLILVNDGTDPTVGTFAGLPEGAIFEASGQFFSISYKAGSGSNDVVVTCVVAPGNLLGVTQLNATTVQLQGSGGSNATYTILANTNIASTNWSSIGTATANGSGIFFFNDTNAALFPQRFFRVQFP